MRQVKGYRLIAVAVLSAVVVMLWGGFRSTSPAQPAGLFAALDNPAIDSVGEGVVAIAATVEGKKCIGSGIIVHPAGLVLTTCSVVPPQGVSSIKVQTIRGETFEARVVEIAEDKETVILKVKAKGLPAAALGDSQSLEVGQITYTLGNVEGCIASDEEAALSMGTLSGIYSLKDTGDYVLAKFVKCFEGPGVTFNPVKRNSCYTGRVLETTAATNLGNDGGPLVDLSGRVIGMMTLAYSKHRWLGLAVPVNEIKPVIEKAMKKSGLKGPLPQAKIVVDSNLAELQRALIETAKGAAKSTVAILLKREEQPQSDVKKELKHCASYGPSSPVSGVILSSDGYIVTSSFRLTAGGDIKSLKVALPDGSIKPAKLIAHSDKQDLAIVKVEATGLTPLKAVKAGELKLGQWVMIIGRAPDPKSPTMTAGIITCLPGEAKEQFLIDACMNPGNVGGAVVDVKGNLLGMAMRGRRFVPNWRLHLVMTVDRINSLRSALKEGKTFVPFLGIKPGISGVGSRGVKVKSVIAGSPAEKAGLKRGDLITGVGMNIGRTQAWGFTETKEELKKEIARRKVGDAVTFKVRRGGSTIEIKITLGHRPKDVSKRAL